VCSNLEVELKRKLDDARRECIDDTPKVHAINIMVFSNEEVHIVPDIEEFGAELNVLRFSYAGALGKVQIHIEDPWPAHRSQLKGPQLACRRILEELRIGPFVGADQAGSKEDWQPFIISE